MSGRVVAVMMLVAVVSFGAGWFASTALSGPALTHVALRGDDGGNVTVVNGDGTKFCFTSDLDHQEHCGETLNPPALAVGDRIAVTLVRIPEGPGLAVEEYIVVSPRR